MIRDKTKNQVYYTQVYYTQVYYTLGNQKKSFDFLKSLWSTVDILRGSLDPSKYKLPVMTLLFLKRLNETFEENTEKIIKEGKRLF